MNITLHETDKVAIATVILKLIGADKRYEKEELRYLQTLYINYDIPLIIQPGSRIGYEQAVKSLQAMSAEKKSLVGEILQGLAECDSNLDQNELQLINSVIG